MIRAFIGVVELEWWIFYQLTQFALCEVAAMFQKNVNIYIYIPRYWDSHFLSEISTSSGQFGSIPLAQWLDGCMVRCRITITVGFLSSVERFA
jgi:hypothetical protein